VKHKSLTYLYLPFAQKIPYLQEAFRQETGKELVVIESYRSYKRQQRLYDQGRSMPGEVVTNAQAWQSYHQYGLAVDFAVDMDPYQKGIQDPFSDKIDWEVMAELCRRFDLRSGAAWKDYGHVEVKTNLKHQQLYETYFRPSENIPIFNVWAAVTRDLADL
jgi:peptidoglycan L-alanyl-D-glutamate endopeptidase CwlK